MTAAQSRGGEYLVRKEMHEWLFRAQHFGVNMVSATSPPCVAPRQRCPPADSPDCPPSPARRPVSTKRPIKDFPLSWPELWSTSGTWSRDLAAGCRNPTSCSWSAFWIPADRRHRPLSQHRNPRSDFPPLKTKDNRTDNRYLNWKNFSKTRLIAMQFIPILHIERSGMWL